MAIIKAADQITIIDVTDGYSVDLSSNSYVFGGTASGQVSSTQVVETIIQATRGSDTPTIDVDQNAIDIRPANNGVTAVYSVETVGGKNVYKVTITATVATTQAGTVTIPVKLDGGEGNGGVTINKVFSFNIAKAGSSIVDVQNWYLATSASSGVTKETAGWTTTVQQMTAVNQYLWNYEVTYGTGQIELDSTAPVIIGRYGQDGSAGKSIDSIVEWYQVSAISATPPATPSEAGTGYERNPQVTSVNTPYLWNYEVIYYTDNTYTVTNARIIGVHGLTGPAGTGISSTLIKYAVNTSSTTPPVSFPTGSDWHDDVQPTSTGQYLWTGMKFIYDDGTESLPVYTVAAHGTPATTYHLQASTDAIIKPQTGSLTPSSITFSSYQQTGNDNPITYTGDFGIAVSTDGNTFGTETITANVNHVDYSPASNVKLIKCTLYKLGTGSGSSKVVYDTQTVPVLSDGKSATQYYTYVRYSAYEDGHDYVTTPTADTKYIGVCVTTSSSAPAYNNSAWKWSLYVGANGYNTTTKYIYKRLGTAPSSAPADSTYTFSTGVISNLPSGWSESIPAQNQNGDPCYVTSATALSQEDTGTLDWAVPTLFIENAYNSATIYLYKRGTTSPAGPTADLTYDFTTGQLTPSSALNGWSMSVPVDTTDPCWMIMATVLTNIDTDVIDDTEWSTPVRIDGIDGAKGLNQATVFYYKRQASAPSIGTDNPGTVVYTFETGSSASPSNGWYRTIPTSDGNPCWVTSASAIGTEATTTIQNDKWAAATKLVEDGDDAYTIILTNENQTFAGDTTSALPYETTCGIIAYKGESAINTRVRVANITGIPSGMTVTASGGNNYVADNVLTITVTSAMNTRNGILTIPVEVPGGKTFNMNFTYSLTLIGESATAYKLIVSNAAIVKTSSGYTPSTITLSSKKQTGSANMENYSGKFKVEKTADGSTWNKVYVSDTVESSYTCTVPASIKALRCLLYTSDSTFNSSGALTSGTLLDQQVVPIVEDGVDGAPAYTVILSNENHTFPGNATSALNGSVDCEIIAYKGASKITSTIGTITGLPDTGMSYTVHNSSNVDTLSYFTITVSPDASHLLTSGGGVLTVPVTVDGNVFNMNFTYSVAFKGVDGTNGANGYNTATVYLYKRSESQPTGSAAKPSNTLTYTFSSKALTPSSALNGWSTAVPSTGSNPCWLIAATANANTASDTIETTEWSTPIRIDGKDGTDGQPGAPGTNGLNQATLFYYKRSSNTPATNPGEIIYTFADGSTSTVYDNWSKTIPTSDGNPCWVVSAVAIGREGTVTIPSTAWSTPSKLVEDGTDGDPATAYRLTISAAAIMKATSGSYTPSSITLNSKSQTGDEPLQNYPARFKIETTSNGTDWSTSSSVSGLYYQSSSDESSKTFDIPSGITALRCSLYKAGGFTTLLDQQIVPIVEEGSDSYTVILSDENHTFSGTDTAAIASTASCDVMVYKGSTQVIATIGTITGTPSLPVTGMTIGTVAGSADPFAWPKFTVSVNTSFTTRSGILSVPITVSDNGQTFTFTKIFTYSLALNGSSPVVRELEVSQAAIVRDENGNYTPSTLTLNGKQQVGNNNPSTYSGRFKIEKTTNGSTWTEVEKSSVNENSHTLSTIPVGIKALKCSLYAAGGFTTLLDQQTVPVVEDGDDSYTVVLSNESHTYAGDETKAIAPVNVVSQVIAYKGSSPVYVRIGTITCPTGMTITPNYPSTYDRGNINLTISINSNFTSTSGTINIPVKVNSVGDPNVAEYDEYTQEFIKVFTYTVALKGQAATAYSLLVNNATVVKSGDTYTPTSIIVSGKSQRGDSALSDYAGRFRIETSVDGITWSTSQSGSTKYYESTSNENSHSFDIPANIKALRCSLYLAGGFTTLLDQQVIPVISDGYNSATVYLYKESASQPTGSAAKPSGALTYTFSSGALTPSSALNSWSQTVPTSGTNPCWMIVATAISAEATDTIATTEWTAPIRLDGAPGTPGTPGDNGYNAATVYFYKRTNTTPSDRPGTTQYPVTYDFSTGETSSSASTAYYGWSRSIPTANGNACWVTSGAAISQSNTVDISTWADPTKLVEDGYTVVLTNESHSFPGQDNGSSYATASSTTTEFHVYKGTTEITSDVTISNITGKPSGMNITKSGNILTIAATTSMSSASGTLSIPIVADGQTFTKQFSYAIVKTGTNGTSPTIQDLVVAQSAITRTKAGTYNPSTINLSATERVGNDNPQAYSGWFKVEYLVPGGSWTQSYKTGSTKVSSVNVDLTGGTTGMLAIPSTATLLKCSLFKHATNETSTYLLDTQTIPIVVDGDDACTVVLTNESYSFPGQPDGSSAAIVNSQVTSDVNVYKGASQLQCYVGASSSATTIDTGITGLTCSIANNDSTNPTLTFTASPSGGFPLTTGGSVDIPIHANGQTFTKQFSFTITKTGTSPTIQELVVSQAAVSRTKAGTYNPTSINLSAVQRVGNSAPGSFTGWFKVEYFIPGSNWAQSYKTGSTGGSSVDVDLTGGTAGMLEIPSTATLLRCSLFNNATSEESSNLLDRQTIPIVPDGVDAYTITLSNETDNFPGQANGVEYAEGNQTAKCEVKVYKGTTNITSSSTVTITSITNTVGTTTTSIINTQLRYSISTANNKREITFTTGNGTSSYPYLQKGNGVATISIAVDGQTFTKQFTFGVTVTGPQGEQGVGISDTQIRYAKSTNGTTPPQNESDWKNSVNLVGTVNPGEYLWTRTRIYYSDNRDPVTSYSVAAYGLPGTDGADAITLSVNSSGGWQFTEGNINTTLTARVFKGTVEQTTEQIGELGQIDWEISNFSEAFITNQTKTSHYPVVRSTYTNGNTTLGDIKITKKSDGSTIYGTFYNASRATSGTLSGMTFKNGSGTTVTYTLSAGDVLTYTYTNSNKNPADAINSISNVITYKVQLINNSNVIAISESSLSLFRDIRATYVFYNAQDAAISSMPNPPTEEQVNTYISTGQFPSECTWSDSEPTPVDTTKNLFRVEVTRYSDLSLDYSAVTKDSGYEAAKAAKATADQANATANNANTNANTALSNSTSALNKANQESEIITGTQVSATNEWTGASHYITALVDGLSINYWLPYNSAANVTLALTLANNTTTAKIPVYYGGTTQLGTQYGAGNLIRLVYRENVTIGSGTYTGWWADANYNTNDNYYDRLKYNSAIKAATEITAGHLICGTVNGYKNIAADVSFDLSYPLLYAGSTITAGETGTNNYLNFAVTFSTSGSIVGGAANKILYLKGTVDGNIFTIASSDYLTTVVPTSEDDFYYIPLGTMTNGSKGRFVSSNSLFAYIFDEFQAVDVAAIVTRNKVRPVPVSTVNNIGIKKYSLIMRDSTGAWASIVASSGTGTDKNINPAGFYIDKILYNAGSSDLASGTATKVYSSYSSIDFRYSSNCGTSLIAREPVYLVGTTQQDGLFVLEEQGWTQNVPSKNVSLYNASTQYSVGNYVTYKEVPNFSSSEKYEVGDYVKYDGNYYSCVLPVSTPGDWNPLQWIGFGSEMSDIPDLDLYRCKESTTGSFDSDKWILVTNYLYVYIGNAYSTTNIELEENNTIFKWRSDSGLIEYSLYITSTYDSKLDRFNDRIESKVSQTTYSAAVANINGDISELNGQFNPENTDSYAAKIAQQFTLVNQTANNFSISLYGASIYDADGNPGTIDPTSPTADSIAAMIKAQEDAINGVPGEDGLRQKLDKLSVATGYEKLENGVLVGGARAVDYFSFEKQGLVIGSSTGSASSIVLVASNSRIGFYDVNNIITDPNGDVDVEKSSALMYIDTSGMHSQENVLSEQINMFNNWAFRKGGSGTTGTATTYNLNDVWIGG